MQCYIATHGFTTSGCSRLGLLHLCPPSAAILQYPDTEHTHMSLQEEKNLSWTGNRLCHDAKVSNALMQKYVKNDRL